LNILKKQNLKFPIISKISIALVLVAFIPITLDIVSDGEFENALSLINSQLIWLLVIIGWVYLFLTSAFILVLIDISKSKGKRKVSRIPLGISMGLLLIIVVITIYAILVPKISGGPDILPEPTPYTTETG